MRDDLGARMKEDYEHRTRVYLPRRTYTLLRADGKAFHTYTKGCQRPYDPMLMEDMDFTAKAMCEQISGAQLAFVQSDEISILVTDFESQQTEAWFDGNLQKIASVAASIATAKFNQFRWTRAFFALEDEHGASAVNPATLTPAYFDCRAWTIPDRTEVSNYFIWRQQDSTRNSVSMSAQAQFSHKALQGKSSDEMQEMLFQERGINWNNYPAGFKRGRCLVKATTTKPVTYTDKRTGEEHTLPAVERREWQVVEAPIFTQDREWLYKFIPERG